MHNNVNISTIIVKMIAKFSISGYHSSYAPVFISTEWMIIRFESDGVIVSGVRKVRKSL